MPCASDRDPGFCSLERVFMPHVSLHQGETRTSALWNAYWESGRSDAARNALMEHYLPLVRLAATRLASRNGRRASAGEIDDLQQYGIFGLRDAIRGFDPERGAKFETYCLRRVRGAMLDGLKSNNWVPRDVRHRLSQFTAAQQLIEAEQGPGLKDEAIASRIGVCTEAIARFQKEAATTLIASFHAGDGEHSHDAGGVQGADIIPDHREEDPALLQQRKDLRDLFFRELTRSERHLLMLYYYEELTMREIGEVLGISGTRVSQLHSEIVARLRERFASRMTDRSGRSRAALEI
jgi:RNA polymerase sigma factor for flagellar operon FliA